MATQIACYLKSKRTHILKQEICAVGNSFERSRKNRMKKVSLYYWEFLRANFDGCFLAEVWFCSVCCACEIFVFFLIKKYRKTERHCINFIHSMKWRNFQFVCIKSWMKSSKRRSRRNQLNYALELGQFIQFSSASMSIIIEWDYDMQIWNKNWN